MKTKASILGVNFDIVDIATAESIIWSFIDDTGESARIVTANTEVVMMAQNDKALLDIINSADLVTADGAGIVWAANRVGCPLPERVAGFDLVQKLLVTGAERKTKFFFFGAAPGVAKSASEYAKKHYAGIEIAGIQDGYFSGDENEVIISKIRESNTEILLVALGMPKQELWLAENLKYTGAKVGIGIGGSFDIMAGNIKRAPIWMRKYSLEWLYRLYSQPSRIGRMMAIPEFILKIIFNSR